MTIEALDSDVEETHEESSKDAPTTPPTKKKGPSITTKEKGKGKKV